MATFPGTLAPFVGAGCKHQALLIILCEGSKPDGRDAARLGSREPGAAIAARAEAEKGTKINFGEFGPRRVLCLRVVDSNPEHWEALLQFCSTCPGAGPQIRQSTPSV